MQNHEPTQNSRPLKIFTTYMLHLALGEGYLEEVTLVLAYDEDGARQSHLQILHPRDAVSQAYYKRGVEVFEGIQHDLLARWLTPRFIASLEHSMPYLGAFQMQRSYNAEQVAT